MTSPEGICLICGSKIETTVKNVFDTRFGIKGFYDVGKCLSCGLEQLFPRPDGNELKKLYEDHYNFQGGDSAKYRARRQKFLSSFLYRFWMFIDGDIAFYRTKGRGRLLDVGCNEGRGMIRYQRNGYTVEGLEINRVAAQAARSLGFMVHADPLESFQPSEAYDVAVLANVLEHSLAPADMLESIGDLLMPGGQVWISCPNGQSWYKKIFGRYWINWHPPFHLVHFSRTTLVKMLNREGFAVETVKNETPALWVAQSLIAAGFARLGIVTRQLRTAWLVGGAMLLIRLLFFPLLWLGNLLGRGDCLVIKAYRGKGD
ncbi:class I SAM-dependent methyltransferase [candidate division TA06 bacterium]|uniref:Class I SAM-dependent methyltransferase n=1 Tax=candidate division TA06 bacterium TaxID=2250710 RepID=A0A933I9L4_UNCT6|nr:class I SAM-dependent methyltransferase [candidate division TA06 bacterium]